MKKILFYTFFLLLSATSFATNLPADEQLSKLFKKSFPFAVNTKWFQYENFYEVLFENNGIVCRGTYDLKGNIISMRRDYYEKDLPLFILAKVKEKYNGKKIFGVTEISSTDGVSYTIALEDDKNWITIRSDESGNTEFVKKLKKA